MMTVKFLFCDILVPLSVFILSVYCDHMFILSLYKVP